MINNLAYIRENCEYKQKDISSMLNMAHTSLSRWENDIEIIPLKHLNTLCNYYNTSMDYALCLSNLKNNNHIKKIRVLNKKDIGQKLKIIRKENNLTLKELSKELNTTPSAISYYENGHNLILTVFAYQICKKYNISLDWLCGRSKIKYLDKKDCITF